MILHLASLSDLYCRGRGVAVGIDTHIARIRLLYLYLPFFILLPLSFSLLGFILASSLSLSLPRLIRSRGVGVVVFSLHRSVVFHFFVH